MTSPIARPDISAPWTVDDLLAMPDDGYRYEIFDGSLLVTPPPVLPHAATVYALRRLLERQAPPELAVMEGVGVYPRKRDFYVPDLLVIPAALLRGRGLGTAPADALLVVEVVSPSNPGNDLVLKRKVYAALGIREYWIADERDRTLRVLSREESGRYVERAQLQPGQRWSSDEPFRLVVDPGEIF